MKVLYINSVCGFGSTGKIVYELAKETDSLVCYGRKRNKTDLNNVIKITNVVGNVTAAFGTMLLNKNALCNTSETKRMITIINEFNPDVINIHNMHGYYLNYEILFRYLKSKNIPVVLTLHDCFCLTGYCMHFEYIGCNKWKDNCDKCPMDFSYPFSLFKQNVSKQYKLKKELYNDIENLTIVTPSEWLKKIVEQSFLKKSKISVINNGIDLECFYPSKPKNDILTVIAISSVFTKKKGLDDLEKIIQCLQNVKIIVVGKLEHKIKVNENCVLINRTESVEELRDLYSQSHFMLNLTLEDTFPTINIESLACGTPVITYKTGGSPEIIDEKTGVVIEKNDYESVVELIKKQQKNYTFRSIDCVKRSKKYSKRNMVNLYKKMFSSISNK